jgi:hypothetical protein
MWCRSRRLNRGRGVLALPQPPPVPLQQSRLQLLNLNGCNALDTLDLPGTGWRVGVAFEWVGHTSSPYIDTGQGAQ